MLSGHFMLSKLCSTQHRGTQGRHNLSPSPVCLQINCRPTDTALRCQKLQGSLHETFISQITRAELLPLVLMCPAYSRLPEAAVQTCFACLDILCEIDPANLWPLHCESIVNYLHKTQWWAPLILSKHKFHIRFWICYFDRATNAWTDNFHQAFIIIW